MELQNMKFLEEIQLLEMRIDKQKKVQNNEQKEIDGYQQEIDDLQTKIEREDATNKRLDKKLATLQKEIIETKRKQSAGVGTMGGANN